MWSDDKWVGDDRDASCSSSSSSRVSVALAGVSDRNDGRDNSCTEAADAVVMASYRGQFTRGKTCPRRGDGERQG